MRLLSCTKGVPDDAALSRDGNFMCPVIVGATTHTCICRAHLVMRALTAHVVEHYNHCSSTFSNECRFSAIRRLF